MVAILCLIIVWFLFIRFMVNESYYLIKTNQIVNHTHNAIMTLCSAIIASGYYVYFFGNESISQLVYVLLWLLFGYWLVFDIWLNTKRDKGKQYLGRKSKLDLFLRKYSFGQPIAFKLVCIVLLNVWYYGYYSVLK